MIDIHNHTIFSDGKDSVADVIQAAVERDLKIVGISDHFDPYLLRQDVCLQPEKVSSYSREIERLKGSYPITVLSGLELGLQSTGISWPVGDFDYYIYSVHTVPGFPDLKDMEDPWDIYLEEAAMAVELIDKPGFLGHLDFLRRHIPGSKPPSPGELMNILLKQIIACDVGLEFNTSGWMYRLGDPTPQPWVIERYLELGGRLITIGSDSHRAISVGKYNNDALNLLRKLGISEVFYAVKDRYLSIPI